METWSRVKIQGQGSGSELWSYGKGGEMWHSEHGDFGDVQECSEQLKGGVDNDPPLHGIIG